MATLIILIFILVAALVISLGINILLAFIFLEQRRMITTDMLTGLLNKVGLTEVRNRRHSKRMNGSWFLFERRHKDHPTGGAILYLDLDKFKPVNDQYGHHVGDLLIVEFSKFLKQHMRAKDTLARLHGDEFVIALEDVDEAEAKKVASKIVTSLKNHTFIAHGHEIKLEATIGVAVMKNDRLFDLDALIKDADHAMLKSKRRVGDTR